MNDQKAIDSLKYRIGAMIRRVFVLSKNISRDGGEFSNYNIPCFCSACGGELVNVMSLQVETRYESNTGALYVFPCTNPKCPNLISIEKDKAKKYD